MHIKNYLGSEPSEPSGYANLVFDVLAVFLLKRRLYILFRNYLFDSSLLLTLINSPEIGKIIK